MNGRKKAAFARQPSRARLSHVSLNAESRETFNLKARNDSFRFWMIGERLEEEEEILVRLS